MRKPVFVIGMSLLLLTMTNFASTSAIELETKHAGPSLLAEGPEMGTMPSSPAESSPAPSASEAEQQEPAPGDIRERSLKSGDPDLATKGEFLLTPTVTTPTCPTVLPATPTTNPAWAGRVLDFVGNINVLPTPYWIADNASIRCAGCTFFGVDLWKSKLGGGINNTAFGYALYNNNCGSENTAMGREALINNISGSNNTAIGRLALSNNTTGPRNTAIGREALNSNISGYENTAMGMHALSRNTTGSHNTALGYAAGVDQSTGSYNVYIDNSGQNGESHTIRIGRPATTTTPGHTRIFVAGITTASITGIPVEVIGGDVPQLGIRPSSRRYKTDIHDLGKASEGLQRLRPVAFRYKADAVAGGGAQDYGLIAEEVAEVYPELVGRNAEGEIITVHYQKLIPMLLNELHQQQNINHQQQRKNDELEARLRKLESK